jgi:hypothetical protein
MRKWDSTLKPALKVQLPYSVKVRAYSHDDCHSISAMLAKSILVKFRDKVAIRGYATCVTSEVVRIHSSHHFNKFITKETK